MSTTSNAADPLYLPSDQLRARYGDVSNMWIERRLTDNSGFPKPIYIAKRRFWKLSELEAWERSLATSREATPTAEVA